MKRREPPKKREVVKDVKQGRCVPLLLPDGTINSKAAEILHFQVIEIFEIDEERD